MSLFRIAFKLICNLRFGGIFMLRLLFLEQAG